MVKLKTISVAMAAVGILSASMLGAGCHHRSDGTGGGPGGGTDTDKYETGSNQER